MLIADTCMRVADMRSGACCYCQCGAPGTHACSSHAACGDASSSSTPAHVGGLPQCEPWGHAWTHKAAESGPAMSALTEATVVAPTLFAKAPTIDGTRMSAQLCMQPNRTHRRPAHFAICIMIVHAWAADHHARHPTHHRMLVGRAANQAARGRLPAWRPHGRHAAGLRRTARSSRTLAPSR